MDRQTLLEQKRQRLQELKQKRLGKESLENRSASPSLQDANHTSNKVNVAIQVDLVSIGQSTPDYPTRLDKATQTETSTHPPSDEDIKDYSENDENSDDNENENQDDIEDDNEDPKENQADTINASIQTQLKELGISYPFSNLRLGVKHHEHSMSGVESPFSEASHLSNFLNRPITCFATTPTIPNVLAVGYSKPLPSLQNYTGSIAASNGLVVLFNTSVEPMLPEFFLLATSPITTLMFDKFDSFRLVAGTDSGRVAVWDLNDVQPAQVAILPTLQTTLVTADGHDDQIVYLHHTSRIVLLHQPDTNAASPSVVSVSSDGIINVWSLSMLAFPKLGSRKVVDPVDSVVARRKPLGVLASVMLDEQRMSSENVHAHFAPEYQFLNRTILGCRDGKMFKLRNEKATNNLVDTSLVGGVDAVAGSVLDMAVLLSDSASLILTCHTDWKLRLWYPTDLSCAYSIPTGTLVSKVCVRPTYPFQFVSLSTVNPPRSDCSLHFWDLTASVYSPILAVPLEHPGKNIRTVAFDKSGSHLFAGSDNGELWVWTIDNDHLLRVAEAARDPDIDGGIDDKLYR